jgi:ribosome-associated protein
MGKYERDDTLTTQKPQKKKNKAAGGRRPSKGAADKAALESKALPRRAREPLEAPAAPRSSVRPGDPARGQASKVALAAVEAALDKKAIEPALFDVRDLASYTDYIMVCSGRSDRQVHSIVEGIREVLKAQGLRTLGVEDSHEGQWSLLDFGELIVHVFHHPVREFYDLESLWIDAPRVHLELPPESRIQPESLY